MLKIGFGMDKQISIICWGSQVFTQIMIGSYMIIAEMGRVYMLKIGFGMNKYISITCYQFAFRLN